MRRLGSRRQRTIVDDLAIIILNVLKCFALAYAVLRIIFVRAKTTNFITSLKILGSYASPVLIFTQ